MAKLTPEELKKARRNLRDEARQRVADRGILQFRADKETVLAVMDAADKLQMPVGSLLRQWVQERLMITNAKERAPDLVQRVGLLEEAVNDLQKKLK